MSGSSCTAATAAPPIAEFAPAELGVLLKISSGAAASYIGEALALRHRLPRIWAKTLNGHTVVWRARAVARACLKLSLEAAALVDERVVAVIDTLSAYRLQKIIDAVVKEADPDAARQAAEQHARERGVWVQPSDDHGTKTIWVKASSGDVIAINASLNDVAWALSELGDPDSLSERRAKAIGWLADPLAAYELLTAARYLATHPTPTNTPTTDTPTTNTPTADAPAADAPATDAPATDTPAADAPATDAPGTNTNQPSTAAPLTNPPGAPTDNSTGAPATNALGAPAANPLGGPAANPPHDSSDAKPRLPKATAPEPTRDLSHADPNQPTTPNATAPGTPAAEPSGDVLGVKLRRPAGPTPESPGNSPDPELSADIVRTGTGERGSPQTPATQPDGSPTVESDLPEVPADEPPVGLSDYGDPSDSGDPSNFHGLGAVGVAGDFREPDLADEPDWDAPHPSIDEEPASPTRCPAVETRAAIDPYSRHQLASKLATIKNAAHAPGASIATSGSGSARGVGRGGRVVLYVHITDETLLTGEGIVRVEEHGAFIATQLKELLGHNQVLLKPVIDLNQHIDVNAYEIPTRIRERIRLAQPVERFPYSTTETTPHTDLDHIQPYDPHGPPGQTSTTNLTPATRYHHRVKTHAHGWRVRPAGEGALHWTTPNGFTFRVDHTGTHRLT